MRPLTAWSLAMGRRSGKRYAELCVSSASRFIPPKRMLLPNLCSLTGWCASALTGLAGLTCSSALRLASYTSALAFKHQRSLHVVPSYVCTICNNITVSTYHSGQTFQPPTILTPREGPLS